MNRQHLERLEPRTLLAITTVGVIGDYGVNSQAEADVADLIKGWKPHHIATVGDNNYPVGAASTIDVNIGQYFHEYIFNYPGSYGAGSPTRRFLPALGNHDWDTPGATPYLDYFDLPGNERYYEWTAGAMQFFMLDSDMREPDGTSPTSAQGQWLQARLAASSARFKIILMHHPPYSSGTAHGDNPWMQWPFSAWGASAVLGGHEHTYERIIRNGIPHFINGLGGAGVHKFGAPVAGSEYRFNSDSGAMRLDADDVQNTLSFSFYTRAGTLIDTYTLRPDSAIPSVTVTATDSNVSEAGGNTGTFTFTRTGSTAQPLTVNFSLAGAALDAIDFVSIPTSVTFAPGSPIATLQIAPYDDPLVEGGESLSLMLNPEPTFNRGAAFSASMNVADNDSYSLIFPGGSTWRYLDNGSDQGVAWRAVNFPAAGSWPGGGARFGYGDPGMVTTINGGPSGNRFITHYFRTNFNVADAPTVAELNLHLLRDDGAILYINGVEAARSNMPGGVVTFQTLASGSVGGADESTFFTIPIDPALLLSGSNLLAVELHQSGTTTSDAVFDMYFEASLDVTSPATPSTPDLDAASDSGSSSGDNVTSDNTPRITGTAEPGTTVKVFSDGVLVGSGISIGGFYDIPVAVLADGPHAITATATDPSGNASVASSALAVTIDTAAPNVTAAQFLDDEMPMLLRFAFDEDVSSGLSASDLLLEDQTHGTTVPATAINLTYDGSKNLGTFTFPGFSGRLPDARYRATIAAANVVDPAGNSLSAPALLDLVHFAGDANHDGMIDSSDFNVVATNFGLSGRSFSQGDFNYDPQGVVNSDDFNILASNYGITQFRTRGHWLRPDRAERERAMDWLGDGLLYPR